ncbi:MAG: short-chain dehydrogenase [Thermobacillus sp.]|uniref:SDR family NAD(P)-dependent oxidoreductase n=1 Tax=Thermobacillus sp. TaxID=2108467 RepID=UPI000E3655BE|nr:SDR family NAD(P)-dependent oxidoreductase [Thermobacillus sp.]REK58022.1 MAG: short-chain dehydrogenase [Thermobacillus sp.]
MEKTAYVTGCDRGLGLALAKVLLTEGYRVFAGSYIADWPELGELAEKEPKLRIVPLDIGSDKSVQRAADIVKAETDHLDILINNAAIYRDRSEDIFGDLYFDDMLNMYNVNTLGTLRVTNSVIDLLVKGEGKRLVNISSEAGSIADNWRKREYGYCMTKAAVNMQSAILQNHLQEYGIKVMCFHPGWVRSWMSGKFNDKATVEAIDSAKGIIAQVLQPQEITSLPSYTDYTGKPLPW